MARKKRRKTRSPELEKARKQPRESAPRASDIALPDRRATERMMADLHALLAQQDFQSIEEANEFLQSTATGAPPPPATPETDLERAQYVMYDAFDAAGERRLELARKALEISPDCADAYVLLGQEGSGSLDEELELYEKGMAAGERALGTKDFEEARGHFWSILETRPYMRARLGVAMGLWEMGRREGAAQHLQEMLELNPGDNQGVRMTLAMWLLQLRRHDDLAALLEQFQGDSSLQMVWAKAIWTFRTTGAGPMAYKRLVQALEGNPWVLLYMTDLDDMPDVPPEFVTAGGQDEAAELLLALSPLLDEDFEVVQWLASEISALMTEEMEDVE